MKKKSDSKVDDKFRDDVFSKLKHAIPLDEKSDVFKKIKTDMKKKGIDEKDIFKKLKQVEK